MKKIILTGALLAMATLLFAENFDFTGYYYNGVIPSPYDFVFQKNNKVKLSWFTEDGKGYYKKIYSYKKEYIGRLPLFVLNEDIPRNLVHGVWPDDKTYYGNKFILLTGLTESKNVIGLALLPKRKNEKATELFYKFPTGGSGEYPMFNYEKASSFLIERDTEYSITNLTNISPETPWVEGVKGWGIGENFIIKTWNDKSDNHILLMNGYISARNPHLYEENGRIKKIEVKGVKSGKKKNFIVKDTPHPQSIDISFLSEPEDIKITILDVYKGTKYQDTCIHFMILWSEKVIPWE